MQSGSSTPVYCLETFGEKAEKASFYIEILSAHLREYSFVNSPHKHDHYLVLYITKGGGTHTIDFRSYDVKPGSFFLMSPGQVHAWSLYPDTDGFVIFFRNDFRLKPGDHSLSEFGGNPLILPKDLASLAFIIKEMYREKDLRILRAWLEVFLVKLSSYQHREHDAVSDVTYKLRKLEQFIEKNFIRLKRPGEYSDLMNLSTAHLNSLCKRHLGKTLSHVINERIVLEAKRLFAYTDLTVAQVSNRLKFSEPSYFIRFFRKNAGLTPDQFKENTIRAV